MTKIVLVKDGAYLRISTNAMLELLRRGCTAIDKYDLQDDPRFVRLHDFIPTEDGYLVHHYYPAHLKKGTIHYHFQQHMRGDPVLVQLIEELGDVALVEGCHAVIVHIPDDVAWGIQECETDEWIAEKHRVWRLGTDDKVYEDTEP